VFLHQKLSHIQSQRRVLQNKRTGTKKFRSGKEGGTKKKEKNSLSLSKIGIVVLNDDVT
jgi:tRNA splicing endonuclease